MALAASRELADAVTDPDLNYKAAGWRDDTFVNPDGSQGTVAGAVSDLQTVWLNGYAVQRVAERRLIPGERLSSQTTGSHLPAKRRPNRSWSWPRTARRP